MNTDQFYNEAIMHAIRIMEMHRELEVARKNAAGEAAIKEAILSLRKHIEAKAS